MTMALITAEILRALLHYEPETGVFMWLKSGKGRRLNRVAGQVATDAYLQITINGRKYSAHRLAWLYMMGEWPKAEIDHINTDRADNRWCNLRESTRSQNSANATKCANTSSYFKGVYWNKQRCKWQAQIEVNGKHIPLGRFAHSYLAYAAYCLAARKHFGDYARVYEADQLIIPRKVFEDRILLNLLAATQPQFERAA
jgi:hypothetical protein